MSDGKYVSEGTRLIWLKTAELGLTQRDVTRACGCSDGHISRIMGGKRRAGRKIATKLQQVLGIPVEAWEQAPAVEFAVPVRMRAA